MVNRCATCGSVLNAEGPCPGCLMRLALDEPELRERSSARALLGGLSLGALLGGAAVAVVGGVIALSVERSVGTPVIPDPSELAALEREMPDRELEAAGHRELEVIRGELAALRGELANEGGQARADRERDAEERAVLAAVQAARLERDRGDRERLRAEIGDAAEHAAERRREAMEAARVAAIRAGEEAERAHQKRLQAEAEAERAHVEAAPRVPGVPEVPASPAFPPVPLVPLVPSPLAVPPATSGERSEGSGCDDLVSFETRAVLGKLTPAQQDCLQEGVDGARGAQIARLLAMDAFSRGDLRGWERWAVAVWDREADGDVAYELARHHRGRSAWGEARVWAARALEQRTIWTGRTYTSRVGAMLDLAHKADLAEHGPDDDRTRASAAALADFRRVSGQP